MTTRVAAVKCLGVLAQVTLGYYDEDGNLLAEESFPQSEGSLLTARLFHPHAEQLTNLISTCIEQAWAKLTLQIQADVAMPSANGVQGHNVATSPASAPLHALRPAGPPDVGRTGE